MQRNAVSNTVGIEPRTELSEFESRIQSKLQYALFFPRMGPRQIRCESCLIRPHNTQTGAAPYESLMVADVGDVSINVFNLAANIDIIQQHVASIVNTGCKPLILGGDHTITYPILRAIKVRLLKNVCSLFTSIVIPECV